MNDVFYVFYEDCILLNHLIIQPPWGLVQLVGWEVESVGRCGLEKLVLVYVPVLVGVGVLVYVPVLVGVSRMLP